MKPIFLTKEDKDKMRQEFETELNNIHLFNGSFLFARSYNYSNSDNTRKARILYTPAAYVKMLKLISSFDSEIAWHGLVKRGEADGDFIVYDIITHEQTVSGSTVTTSDEQYIRFMECLTDEEADNMFLQAHSHVNYGVTPSNVDLQHQAKIVQMMSSRKTKGFQIFQIWNKSLKCSSFIYDFANNIYYENKDVETDVVLDSADDYLITDFIEHAKQLVVVTQPMRNGMTTQDKPKTKAAAKGGKKDGSSMRQWWERQCYDDDVDYDEEIFGRSMSELDGYYSKFDNE